MKRTVSISVDPELWEEFKDVCFDKRTNPSSYIEKLIRNIVGPKEVVEIRDYSIGGNR